MIRNKARRGQDLAETAAALTSVVGSRLQDALRSGEADALLAAAVLQELSKQLDFRPGFRLNTQTLDALAGRVLDGLPESARDYGRPTTTS